MARAPSSKRRGGLLGSWSHLGTKAVIVALLCSVVWCVFLWRPQDYHPIDWIRYSEAEFNSHVDNGRTILVYFYSDWHITTKSNGRFAFEATALRQVIKSQDVVAMWADTTQGFTPEVRAALLPLLPTLMPTIAIYSPTSPAEPAVFSGSITEQQIIDALNEFSLRR